MSSAPSACDGEPEASGTATLISGRKSRCHPVPFAKGSKYRRYVGLNDIADRTYKGVLYHSIKERNYAATLENLKHAKDPKERVQAWERQVAMPMLVNGKLICTAFIDFRVIYADGRIEYHEIKGFRTQIWALKEKLFRALYPERILKVIK